MEPLLVVWVVLLPALEEVVQDVHGKPTLLKLLDTVISVSVYCLSRVDLYLLQQVGKVLVTCFLVILVVSIPSYKQVFRFKISSSNDCFPSPSLIKGFQLGSLMTSLRPSKGMVMSLVKNIVMAPP